MGFSGLVAEILLLREFLIVFSGNEFSIGVILANWLILEAVGAFFLGRKAEKSHGQLEAFTAITILFSISLLVAVFLIRMLKGILGISIGESVGLLPIFYSSLLILLPVSILHGTLFTFSCEIYARFSGQDAASAGRVYAGETVGTVIGGIVCTYLLIPYLDTFQASAGLAALNAVICLTLLAPYWKGGWRQQTTLALTGASALFFLVLTGQAEQLQHDSIKKQWQSYNVVHYQNSQYGNICVIENEGQYTFFQDGIPSVIIPVPDIPAVEEFVHLPLLAHPEPNDLLIVSGGAGGVIHEALKHPSIRTIEYVELDPLLIDLFRKFPTALTQAELTDARVKIQHMDGRLLLKTTQNTYDVIFVGITEPSNLQTNRFFTRQFFSLVQERLNEGGILVLGLPGSLTYLNEELKDLNSSIFHTLKSVFPYVRVIPGDGTNLFLLSESEEISRLDKAQIIARLNQRKIETNMTIPWHIEQKLHPGWQGWFLNFVAGSSQKINSDFSPIGVFYSVSHWNALFAPSLRWFFRLAEGLDLRVIGLPLVGALLLYLFFRSRNKSFLGPGIPLSILTTGFAGMIFSLVLTFAFQSIYGYVFSWIGLLVAFFMAGAAGGAMLIAAALEKMTRHLRYFVAIELAIMAFAVGCPVVLLALNTHLGSPETFFGFRMLFLVISFASGFLVGAQFPLANKIYLSKSIGLSKTAGLLYACDLLGGWGGGIIGAVVLLPVLGLVDTCGAVGLLKLMSFVVVVTQPDR